MKKALAFLVVLIAIAVGAYWYMNRGEEAVPAEEPAPEALTQEELVDAAERLKASSQGQAATEEAKTEQEVAAEALAAPAPAQSKDQKALIDAAEALKAQ